MAIESDNIKIPASDGGAFGAYFAKPEGNGPFPAIIVIQEIFGINADMRTKCHELAEQGYYAIAPDLFWRIEPDIELVDSDPEQLQRAFDLYNEFDESLGFADLKTTLGYVRNTKTCTDKAGALGYCLGGKLAYMMAAGTDIDATVGYYGVAIETMLDHAENIENPLILHIAEKDEFVNADAQSQIKTALEDNTNVTIHTYPGMDHAFARDNGMHYNAEAADKANAATKAFFQKHLTTTE